MRNAEQLLPPDLPFKSYLPGARNTDFRSGLAKREASPGRARHKSNFRPAGARAAAQSLRQATQSQKEVHEQERVAKPLADARLVRQQSTGEVTFFKDPSSSPCDSTVVAEQPETRPTLLDHARKRWAQSHENESTLRKRIFGVGPKDKHHPPSRMVYPFSPFALAWTLLTAVLLLYTAVVTPPVIAFYWLDDECAPVPTLFFDLLVDTFFLLDIIFSFSVGVVHQGKYIDDWRWVAKNYLTGSFLFDVCTSVPISYLELSVANVCADIASGVGGEVTIESTQLRFIRAMKPLRWFKLARVIKLNQTSQTTTFVSDYIGLDPRHQRLLLLTLRVAGLIHLGGCLIWLVKV